MYWSSIMGTHSLQNNELFQKCQIFTNSPKALLIFNTIISHTKHSGITTVSVFIFAFIFRLLRHKWTFRMLWNWILRRKKYLLHLKLLQWKFGTVICLVKLNTLVKDRFDKTVKINYANWKFFQSKILTGWPLNVNVCFFVESFHLYIFFLLNLIHILMWFIAILRY